MPYHLEKAPTLSVLEDFTDDGQQVVDAVQWLRDGNPIAEAGFLDSPNLNHGPYPTLAARIGYLNKQWLGMTQDPAGNWRPQPPYGPGNTTTRCWIQWYGDAESILRTTFIRAGEIALDVDFGGPLPDPPPQHPRRRMQVLWKCGQEWFEGWVTWTPDLVTVILATPATPDQIWRNLDPYTPNPGPPDFERDPLSYPPEYGMLVVGHEHNLPEPVGWLPTGLGNIAPPLTVWHSQGDVITVVPAEQDGGVLHRRRTYR
jgi:hypothetical protein